MLWFCLILFAGLGISWAEALTAFPGAEGFGRFAQGGRGGEVFHVTSLEDSGPGTLRDALSKSGRTIVFDVGGVIRIKSRLVVPAYTTIAGQTAPGGGITIYGNGMAYNTHNTVTRHIRIRMGKVGDSGKDAVSIAEGRNMIWDHVSISWGRDGTFDANPSSGKSIENITLQNCIIAQGLQTHSTGGLLIAKGASVLRSLYIDNNSRNPKARQTTQFVNNVIYNWTVSAYILGDTEGRSDGYLVGNYFITGPSSRGGTLSSPTAAYNVFAAGNYYDSDKNGSLNGRLLGKGDFGSVTWWTYPSVAFPDVTELSADSAYRLIFNNAGANRWYDEVDRLLFRELASLGKSGQQISDEASLGLKNNVGDVPGGSVPVDSDRDGMPDAWEALHGLNPNDPADRNGITLSPDGYTNLEMYLNELAGDPVVFATVPHVPGNTRPAFVSRDTFFVAENTVHVGVISASDADQDALSFFLAASSDSALFQINSLSGELTFLSPPDYENPRDNGFNNIHHLMIGVSDGQDSLIRKHIVIVTDVIEDSPTPVLRQERQWQPRLPVSTFDLLGRRSGLSF